MTTKEIYFKNVINSDLPIGLIFFTYKDKNDVIQIGSSVSLEFSTDETIVKKSIKTMKEIEKTDGFMFWNKSPEGEDFFKENWGVISKTLVEIIISQK